MPTFLGCLGAIVLVAMLTAAGWGLRAAMLPGRAVDRTLGTAEGIIDRTLNPENALEQYHWFKQQKEDIDAAGKNVAKAKSSLDAFLEAAGPRSGWTFEDKQQYATLTQIGLGLEMHREQMIGDYNARAKQADRAIFEDGVIPRLIEGGASYFR